MFKYFTTSCFALFFTLSSFSDLGKKRIGVYQKIAEDVNLNGQAYENLKEAIAKIGHRLTGSLNGKKAEEFALESFRSFGYNEAKFLPFETNSWSRNKLTLSLVPGNSDNFRDIKAVSLAHSPKSSYLTARIIDCGDGLSEDFQLVGEVLKGKVALFNIDVKAKRNQGKKNLHRSEKTALAIKNGAAGVIIINKVKGNVLLTGTASVTGELIPIPAVCVSLESGQEIRQWIHAEKNILAEIDMLNNFRPVRARNVSATYHGKSKFENQKIIIGGHLDSWDLAQGAVDNGIGAFSVIDIARVFKQLNLKTKRPIEFVLFMGEEQGLLGSKNYLAEAKQNGNFDDIAMMINLDMLNNAHGFNAMGNTQLNTIIEQIGDEIKSVYPEYGNKNSNKAGLHSDHQPFMVSGIPVCVPEGKLSANALNCYHADCDKIELIRREDLQNNVKYTAMMLYALANMDQLPKVKSSTETRDYLIKENLKKELILGENWFWDI